MKTYVGIDPGASETTPGGIAWLRGEEYGWKPLVTADPKLVTEALLDLAAAGECFVLCEKVNPFVRAGGRMGATSAASIGRMCAVPETVLVAFLIPHEVVTPQHWQKLLWGKTPGWKNKLKTRDGDGELRVERKAMKKYLFDKAGKRWPRFGAEAKISKHSGCADALWIALAAKTAAGG